uniref:Uncharacterized protein n=1 Tax=Romanomermis culicivorax TaxID=13658 RepID=A0A915KAT1_ROMCU
MFSRSQGESNDTSNHINDTQFKTADLLTQYKFQSIDVRLRAYRVQNRQDEWVSIGHPVFVRNKYGRIYDFTPEGIIANIRLLSNGQQLALEKAARKQYPNIVEPFINLIPLQSVTCTTKFIHDDQKYSLRGEVHDLDQFEIVLDVPCPQNTMLRKAFTTRIGIRNNLKWHCLFVAAGQDVQVNQLEITAEQLEEVANDCDLFSTASETYVTWTQLNTLAQKIRNKLSIEEGYDIEEKADRKIVQKLITTAQQAFKHVAVDEALEKLSSFNTKFSDQEDLSPSELKRQLSDQLAVRIFNNKSLLMINQHYSQQKAMVKDDSIKVGSNVESSSSVKNSTHLSQNYVLDSGSSAFNLSLTFDVVNKNQEKWRKNNISLQHQLDELNWAVRNHMAWAQERWKIVPKTLNVALLNRAGFQRDMQISYKKRLIKDAAYKKVIVIPTDSFLPADEIYPRTNATDEVIAMLKRNKKTMIQSYRIVCKEVDSRKDNRTYSGDMDLYTSRYHFDSDSFCYYLDDLKCKSFGDDYFLRDVTFSCKTDHHIYDTVYRMFKKHCYQCCHYEFVYADVYAVP